MRRARWTLVWLLFSTVAQAESPPAGAAEAIFEDLDGDGQKERIAVEADGALRVFGADGRPWGEVKREGTAPPRAKPERPSIEVVRGAGGVFVHAMAKLAGGIPGQAVELVGRVEGTALSSVWSGVTGPQPPDGEWAVRLRVDAAGAVLFQTATGVSRCDGEDALFPRGWDPGTSRFRPLLIAPPTGERVQATAEIPRAAMHQPLGLFSFVAASTARGDEGQAERLSAPRELSDGRLETAWTAGAGSGRGAFVTARARVPGLLVAGLELVAARGTRLLRIAVNVGEERPASTAAKSNGAITSKATQGSTAPQQASAEAPPPRGSRWFTVELDGLAKPGKPVWVPIPPTPASCVTVAIDEIDPKAADGPPGIAELAVYTNVDLTGGIAGAVARLEAGGPGSDALAQALAAHPREVGEKLASATGEGRKRLLSALSQSRDPDAAVALAAALPAATSDERELIAAALASSWLAAAAMEPLLHLIVDKSVPVAARAEAIRIVSHAGGERGAEALWALDPDPSLDGEPALRGQIVRAVVIAGDASLLASASAALAGGAAQHAEDSVRVVGGLGARLRGSITTEARDGAAKALIAAWKRTSDLARGPGPGGQPGKVESHNTDYALRFHLLRAAQKLAHPALISVVEEGAHDPDETLRFAAVEAAAALPDGAGKGVLAGGLDDGDPRVRAAALSGLSAIRDPSSIAAIARLLANDRWPFVRRAAAEALSAKCDGEAANVLAGAASDRDEGVARASLVALGRCDAPRAAALAIKLLDDEHASFAIREQAAVLATTLHPPGAATTLARALSNLLVDPAADERGASYATSLCRALGRLGDPAGEAALLAAAGHPLSPPLRAAAVSALGALCTPNARAAITSAGGDPDAEVRRAAAATHCPARR